MLKIFIVTFIIATGQNVIVIGPLPNHIGLAGCEVSIENLREGLAQINKENPDEPAVDAKCVASDEQPYVENPIIFVPLPETTI